MFFKIIQ